MLTPGIHNLKENIRFQGVRVKAKQSHFSPESSQDSKFQRNLVERKLYDSVALFG